MNVSMQDTYNLIWKLGTVLTGKANPAILETYEAERRQVALDLLKADEEIARYYSERSENDRRTEGRVDFEKMRERTSEFLCGIGVTYKPSRLVARSNQGSSHDCSGDGGTIIAKQDLAPNIKLGARLPSYRVINQADAISIQLADKLKSDGRWRLIVFAGDLKDTAQFKRYESLGSRLSSPKSIMKKYMPKNERPDSVIELLTVHCSPRIEIELLDLPDVFHPYDEDTGWDYEKVFADDVSYHAGFDDAYAKYGIDKKRGCIVVCRPDQHVGYIGTLEDVEDVERYFASILVPQNA